MKHLSGIDASFLHLETPEMPMHVGSLHLFETAKGYKGDFYEDVKAHVGSRMHLADVFQRKLAQMPFELSNPVWVEDDDVDLDYHIRRVVLSKPGTFEQLEQYVGRLHSTLLDRSRPLWEFFVIEGLASGHMALYAKVHHAAVDGQAGVALAKALYDISAEPRQVKPPRPRPRTNQYQLGVAELATAALQNTIQQYVKLITTFPNAVRAVASVAMPKFGEGMMPRFGLPANWSLGPRTHMNVAITNQRAFAARSVPLAEVKQVAKAAGVTLNDMVLAASATALRRYLSDYGAMPDKPLIAGVPVSLREAGNTDANNQVSMILVSLATDLKDPLERLQIIHQSASSSKELSGSLKAAIPTDFPSFGAPWLMTGLATLFGRSRISDQIPPIANVAISNVPGASFPLFMAGARMVTNFPVSIPAHGLALNITVQSYAGSLDYGLTACRKALPDVGDLADYIVEAHRELQTLVMQQVQAAAKTAVVKGAVADAAVAKVAPAASPVLPPPAAPHPLAAIKPTAPYANGAAQAAPATRPAVAKATAKPRAKVPKTKTTPAKVATKKPSPSKTVRVAAAASRRSTPKKTAARSVAATTKSRSPGKSR